MKLILRYFPFMLNASTYFFFIVSRAMLIARAPSPGDVSGHPLVKVWSFYQCHVMMLFLQYLAIEKKIQFLDFWIPHAGTLQQFTRDRTQASIVYGPLANKASRAKRHSGQFFTLALIVNNWVISSFRMICIY